MLNKGHPLENDFIYVQVNSPFVQVNSLLAFKKRHERLVTLRIFNEVNFSTFPSFSPHQTGSVSPAEGRNRKPTQKQTLSLNQEVKLPGR